MKKMYYKVWIIIFIMVILGACDGKGAEYQPTNEKGIEDKETKHKVQSAIEGEYRVEYYNYFAEAPPFRGQLIVNDGEYTFISEGAENTGYDNIFFVRNPKGTYTLVYEDSIDPDDMIEDIEGSSYLANINFIGIDSVEQEEKRLFLLVKYHPEEEKIFLILAFSVYFDPWGISKPLDD